MTATEAAIAQPPVAPRTGAFSLSCVVPVFNEAAIVERFVRALHGTVSPITSDFEIIVVDDGSSDGSGEIVSGLADELGLVLLQLSRNFGKEAAITAGLARARGDAALVIDADFQHPLEMIEPMVARWRDGYDMVYGVRASRSGEGWIKRAGASIFYLLLDHGSRVEIPRDALDFRVIDRGVVDALNGLPERSRLMKGLFAWVGFRTLGVPVQIQPRVGGMTAFRLRQLRRLAVTGVTEFSNAPLRVAGAIGLLVALFAFTWGGWIIIERLVFGSPLPGFATLAVSIMFFSGVQLIFIGVIGEYLGRVYDEVKGRPTYLVAQAVDRSRLRGAPGRERSGDP